MKRWMFFSLLLVLFTCKREEGLVYITSQNALKYFRTVQEICDADSGKLWGENLYGPVMFVDPKTRTIYANVQDKNGLLKEKDGLFTGILPKERFIATINAEFGGTLYAMVPLPKEDDYYRITTRAVHSLYHCYQERHKLRPEGYSANHMNDENSRFLLKLEWKALTDAINTDGVSRDQAIRDALIFRGARREFYSAEISDENEFESMEGLATFTSTKLCTSTNDEFKTRLLENLSHIYRNPSYAWSYGFIHGALYAYLLDSHGFDFTQIDSSDFDLAAATGRLYNIKLPEICRDVAGSLALSYDLPGLRAEEAEREELIRENNHKIVSTYTEKPIVKIILESPNFSFEPEDIFSLDTIGTIYKKLRVADNWGKLVVENGGALLTNDLKTLRVTANDIVTERNHISGEGWHMTLNEGWQLAEDGESFSLFRVTP